MTLLLALLAQELPEGAVARFGSPDGLHRAAVRAFALSPDGARLATGGWDGRLKVWDAATLRLRETLEVGGQLVSACWNSGERLLSLDSRDSVRLWSGGRVVRSFEGLEFAATAALSGDGLRATAVGRKGEIRVWSTSDGKLQARRDGLFIHPDAVTLSPGGERLAWGSSDGLRLLDLPDGEPVHIPWRPYTGAVVRMDFSPDSSLLAVSRADDTIEVLDAKGVSRLRLAVPLAQVCAMAFSADRRLLAAGDNNGELRVWRIDGPKRVLTLRGLRTVMGLAFSPDGRVLYSAEDSGKIRATSLADGRELRPENEARHARNVRALALSPDGQTLASADEDGVLIRWSVAERRPLGPPQVLRSEIYALAHSPDGATLAAAGRDHVFLLEAAGGGIRASLQNHGRLFSAAWSPDGHLLAAGGDSGRAVLWDPAAAGEPRLLGDIRNSVLALAFAPDGGRVAGGGGDPFLRQWNAASGREVIKVPAHNGGNIEALAFSPDGRSLLCAGRHPALQLMDVELDRPRWSVKGAGKATLAAAFSRDGRRIATAGEDGVVRLLDPADGKELRAWKGHAGEVRALAFLKDGDELASAGRDGAILIWPTK